MTINAQSRRSHVLRVTGCHWICLVLTMSKAASNMKRLTLYTNHLTPNGLKVSIYLEELKLADPGSLDYK
jgi:hypothetical protein